VPPVGGLVGAILGSFIYQLMVGNHILSDDHYHNNNYDNDKARLEPGGVMIKSYNPATTTSTISINTTSTVIEPEKHTPMNGHDFDCPI